MKEAWKCISLVEHSHQKCKGKQQKQKEKSKLDETIMKEVKQSIQDMFKQSQQHHHSDKILILMNATMLKKQWMTSW
jgi:hypothetical protein